MKVEITLNIVDVVSLVAAELARRYPGHELAGLTVTSWNTVLFQVRDGMLEEPVRHRLNPDHAELK